MMRWRFITFTALTAGLAFNQGCASSDSNLRKARLSDPISANRTSNTSLHSTNGTTTQALPDLSQAQEYVVFDSSCRLTQLGDGKFDYNELQLKALGNNVNVEIGTPQVGSLSVEQRAQTAMKAASDIQRATAAESVLLDLLLGEDLPKFSCSVATVAYAPQGKDWGDGHGPQVWDVEVSDVQVKPEAIRIAQQLRRKKSNVALPLPEIYRKAYPVENSLATRQIISDTSNQQESLNRQLFELMSRVIATEIGETESPYNVEAARKLIAQGADVNARDIGQTPLMRAAQNGHIQIMKVLLDHGADVNAQDDRGETALMLAADFNDPDMVRLLLARGAKLNLKDRNGFTAWSGSETIGGGKDLRYLEVRRLLKRAGAR